MSEPNKKKSAPKVLAEFNTALAAVRAERDEQQNAILVEVDGTAYIWTVVDTNDVDFYESVMMWFGYAEFEERRRPLIRQVFEAMLTKESLAEWERLIEEQGRVPLGSDELTVIVADTFMAMTGLSAAKAESSAD